MKLAMLTALNATAIEVAKRCGYDGIEIGDISGKLLDFTSEEAIEHIHKLIDGTDCKISSVLIKGAPLSADPADEKVRFQTYLAVCREFGAVLTMPGPMGFESEQGLIENGQRFKKVYGPLTELAEKIGVRMAFENWPGGRPYDKQTSFSATPEMWEIMFSAVDSNFLGLEFDPSHLIWQEIDPYKALADFADKVFIVASSAKSMGH